jgi:hypothetical protein
MSTGENKVGVPRTRLAAHEIEYVNRSFADLIREMAQQMDVTEDAVMLCCMHRGSCLFEATKGEEGARYILSELSGAVGSVPLDQ